MTAPKKDGLNPRQAAFVEEYMIDLNATRAYQKVYKRSKLVSEANSSRLISNAKVAAVIAERMRQRGERNGVMAERVVQELARMGFADVRDVASWDEKGITFKASADLTEDAARMIQSVKSRERTTYDADGNPSTTVELEVKLYPKDPALNLLARHLGMLKDPKADALTNIAEAIRAGRERARKR